MQYFLFPFVLLIYFELLGRTVLYKLKKQIFDFSFLIGFLVVMAIMYLTLWPITAFNGSFYVLLSICMILFVVSLFFIIKNIKNIDLSFNYKLWIVFIVFLVVEFLISYNRTLGEEHGFDTLYYLNMISFNVGNPELNSLHPHFGTYPNTDIQWITYVFQSYYYFIPVVIYIGKMLLGIVGMSFENMPVLVWSFQIFSQMFLIATSITCIKEINSKNKILNLAFIVLLILFIGNFYYNNVFGFIGNNFRMSIHSIATIFLFKYFKNKDNKDFILFIVAMLGMCAVSSTGTFSFVFVMIGLFFVLNDEKQDFLKYFVISLYIPVVNILVAKFNLHWWIFIGVFFVFVLIFVLSEQIQKMFLDKRIKIGTVILGFVIMVSLSFIVTRNLFDFNAFVNNYSEIADMSWDYFMFNDVRHFIFNPIVLIPLAYYLIKNRKNKFSMISWILIILFFNPFVCTFMNKVNWVYYRSYDIIINQFTIIYFINYLIENVSLKYFGKTVTLLTLVSSIVLSIIQIPRYFHPTFIPDENYNYTLKLENSELELIYNIRNMIDDYKIEKPKIINQTFYMPSYIEESSYLFGKEKRYNYDKYDDTSFNLYLIFFPHDDAYDNFWPEGSVPDYNNLDSYLNDCDYDILIVKSNAFDYINGEYKQISSLVEECGYMKTEYSTSEYDVYYLCN